MKKKHIFAIALIFCTTFLNAEVIGSGYKVTESEEEFDVTYYLFDNMKIIEPMENDDVAITQAFSLTYKNVDAELRYSLFTEISDNPENLKSQFAMWVMICLFNATGYEVDMSTVSMFNPDDVKKEFNGDFGCTVFIQNPTSQYGSGFKYMIVEFFAKEQQGLVMRTFLFNDLAFMLNSDGTFNPDSLYFNNYHSFRFMEKDAEGKFISNTLDDIYNY